MKSHYICVPTVAPNVRYAKNINLVIQLQEGSADGRINIPYFEIEYDDISKELADGGAKVQVHVLKICLCFLTLLKLLMTLILF